MNDPTGQLTDAEFAALPDEERALLVNMAVTVDVFAKRDETDGRFGDLPYNDVVDEYGQPIN